MSSRIPNTRPIDAVLARVDGVQRQGKSYRSRCPSCGGRSRKLSIAEGDDGRVLLHCFGGCPASNVIKALALTTADLFPVRLRPETPEERRAWRRAALESQWSAALGVLDYESTIVLIGARVIGAGHTLSMEDVERLAKASQLINEARDVLSGR